MALSLVAFSPALALAASAPALPHTPDEMRAAKGRNAVTVRDDLLNKSPAHSDVRNRNDYAREVANQFAPVLTDANSDARLNTAILIARLGTLSTDKTLFSMLTNPDPTVRYWGAKGLAGPEFSETLKRVGTGPAVDALRKAAQGEKSPIVAQEILRTLTVYGDLNGLLDGLESTTNLAQTEQPDRGTLQALAEGFDAFQKAATSATPPQKTRAALIGSRAASFIAQHYEGIGSGAPNAWGDSARAAVNGALATINKSVGTSLAPGNMSSGGDMIRTINDLVGSPGAPGKLQAANAAIPAPPKIGAAQPATAPATSGT